MTQPYPAFQRQFYDTLLRSQYQPPAARLAEQRRHLDRLVRFCRDHVPYYRDRLGVLFTARGTIDWSRWNEVPPTTRKDLLERREEMLPDHLPATHGDTREEQSSGSTGLPITVRSTHYANLLHSATIYRGYEWFGMDPGREMVVWFGNDPAYATPATARISTGWGAPWDERFALGRRIFLSREMPYEDMLSVLMEHPGAYLMARPAAAHTVALEALATGRRPQLGGVIGFSTVISDHALHDIGEAFGCATSMLYSAKEGMLMAVQCPTGRHYHINEETTVLEMVDDSNVPVASGSTGRVLVTPVFNFGLPLIRYELGDLAIPGEACSCGRTLPVIAQIIGRQHHLFRFPNGRVVAGSLEPTLATSLGLAYYQVAQTGPLDLEVRYVRRRGVEPAPLEPIATMLRERTDPNVRVTFMEKADLERSASGKFIEFVCELPPTTT